MGWPAAQPVIEGPLDFCIKDGEELSALQKYSRRVRRTVPLLNTVGVDGTVVEWPGIRARARSMALLEAWALAAGSFVLYWMTLAPTVLWGDDAFLQLQAVQGTLHASAGSHPLWVMIAHLFTKLPIGEPAYRVNLVSAVFAALAVGLLYLCQRELGIRRPARIGATLAFAVSHTFWAHAVRTEVYSMTLATFALVILFTLRWYRTGRARELALAGVSLGMAISTHVMIVLLGPAVLWLLFVRRRALSRRQIAVAGGATLVALTPLFYLLWVDAQQMSMGLAEALKWALFEFNGFDFSGRFFHFSLTTLPGDVVQWLGYLGLQFLSPALIAGGIGFVWAWRRLSRGLSVFLLVAYVVSTGFAFAYDVGDRYVFYLPSYLIFSFWIGLGFERLWKLLLERRLMWLSPKAMLYGTLALVMMAPAVTYRALPEALYQYSPQFREVRRVPGPNSYTFLLWPSRANYYDARDYAEQALSAAPANAVLLAEPVLATPMQYLHDVEQFRPDVTVRFCCWDIEVALEEAGARPLAVADVVDGIYPMDLLEQKYIVEPLPPIYALIPKAGVAR